MSRSQVLEVLARIGATSDVHTVQRAGVVRQVFASFSHAEAASDAVFTTPWGDGNWPAWQVGFARKPARRRMQLAQDAGKVAAVELVATARHRARPMHWTLAKRHLLAFATHIHVEHVSARSAGRTAHIVAYVAVGAAAQMLTALKGGFEADKWKYKLTHAQEEQTASEGGDEDGSW